MRTRRMKISGGAAVYHCMTRTVNGEMLFEGDREKEVLRKMIRQVADFSGVDILTYCILSNHFHVLVRISEEKTLPDAELLRRYKVLYPKPTKHQAASAADLERQLEAGGDDADLVRQQLLARMGDVSEFMKTLKQRFSVWYNKSHQRYGTLWSERFKSVLVEGKGNPLQTMAAYIDLNPVRAGLVKDPKDYRFCGYAEAVVGGAPAQSGLRAIWASYADGSYRSESGILRALQAHRSLIFGKAEATGSISRERAVQVLEGEDGVLPKAAVLRCRVRYFTDGAILGSEEFVRGFVEIYQGQRRRKFPPKVNAMKGSGWGDLAVIKNLRSKVFA